jgi:hypothetical protein
VQPSSPVRDRKPSIKSPDGRTVFVLPTSASRLWSFELFEGVTGLASSSVSFCIFRTSFRISPPSLIIDVVSNKLIGALLDIF